MVGVAPTLQVYEVPLFAVIVAICPRQREGEFTVMFGNGVMVTVATAVLEQVPSLPVTVYEVVMAGEAVAVFVPKGVAPALQV